MSDRLRVRALGFAPVKGTQHMIREDAVLDEHGPVGDRAYCLVDVERRTVLKTVRNPHLLDEAARFRTTCLIETDVPYIEETWAGRTMALGDRWVRIGAPIPRCAVMDLDPVTGERNARLLKALAGYRPKNEAGEPVFGVYARIVGGRE